MTEEPPTDPAGSTPTNDAQRERLTSIIDAPPISRERLVLWILTIGTIVGLLYVGWLYVGTVVMGLFVYYVTRPVFRRINTRVESRTLAVGVTLLAVALPLLVIVGWAFAILVASLDDLIESDIFGELETVVQPYFDVTTFIPELGAFVEAVIADPSRLADIQIGPALGEIGGAVLSWLGVLFNVGIHGFIVLIFVFYLLRDDHRIANWARSTFLKEGSVLEAYFLTVDRDLHNVYFGNILNALLTGVLASVVYTLLNLIAPAVTRIPEAAFLGLLVGIASLIPVIGIKLVTWPVGAYLLGRALWLDPQTVWFPVLFLLVSFVIVDYIPDQLLRPYVSGRTLHVGAVMLAYTIGPLLFGWYGIFLAPLLFVASFEFMRILFPWLLDPERSDVASLTRVEAPAETEEVPPTDETPTEMSEDPGLIGSVEKKGTTSDE